MYDYKTERVKSLYVSADDLAKVILENPELKIEFNKTVKNMFVPFLFKFGINQNIEDLRSIFAEELKSYNVENLFDKYISRNSVRDVISDKVQSMIQKELDSIIVLEEEKIIKKALEKINIDRSIEAKIASRVQLYYANKFSNKVAEILKETWDKAYKNIADDMVKTIEADCDKMVEEIKEEIS